ncbi:MAG: BtpA/SgcQ family protein [Actinomycetota bacterium]|nr:BtpA/SgcQ family protein [Actinomycetota bacterium]
MTPIPRLVGMVHLLPLPGSPGYSGSMSKVVDAALADASDLSGAGFPSLMVENFGDVPFYADAVPSETVAAMTAAVMAVGEATGLPIGVNVLRNDALSAVAVAAATGCAFIRVNVLTGVMYTDQGPIEGKAHLVQRSIRNLGLPIEVWADVLVKHATPPAGLDIAQATLDTVERGLADAVIVSGPGTGACPDMDQTRRAKAVLPDGTRLVAGSGATIDNLGVLTDTVDTVIVGSSIKPGSDPRNRVDRVRAARFVEAARDIGLI